jgi:hypothetical protein
MTAIANQRRDRTPPNRKRTMAAQREIEFLFTKSGIIVPTTLLWQEAPLTCKAIWDVLKKPFRSRARHAIWSGKEVFFYLPQTMPKDLPLENHTIFPESGEIMFYYMPEKRLKGVQTIKFREPGNVFELAIFYGTNNLRLTMEMGWRGSVFGRIPGPHLSELEGACEDLYWNGTFDIEVRRKSGHGESGLR